MKENQEISAFKKENYQNHIFQYQLEQTNKDFEQIILKNRIFTLMKTVDYIDIFTDQALKAQWKQEMANNHKVNLILIVQDNSQSFIQNFKTLIEQGKLDDAIQLFDQGIKKYQNYNNLYQNKGKQYKNFCNCFRVIQKIKDLREKGLLQQAFDIWDEGIYSFTIKKNQEQNDILQQQEGSSIQLKYLNFGINQFKRNQIIRITKF